MSKTIAIILLSMGLTGCAALKADTGKYVEQAVVEKIKADIEAKLEAHNTSIAQVTSALADDNGKITKQSVGLAVKESATEIAVVEGKKLVDCEIKKLASKDELDTLSTKFLKWLGGAVLAMASGYFSKQLVAWRNRAKKDQAFHDRITMLEQLAGADLGVGDADSGPTIPPPNPASPKTT